MAVAYEYTEEMMDQLNAIRGDKTAFRKLRRQFRKELGLHSNVSSKKVEGTSEGKKLKEKKYSGTNMEQVNKLEEAAKAEEIVDVPVESNKLVNDFEAQEAAEAENKTYTTDDGDTITICVG